MTMPIGRLVPFATAGALGAIAGVHVAWGFGSSFPFPDRGTLADVVVGNDTVPGPAPSFAVAGLLAVTSGLVVDGLPPLRPVRRLGLAIASLALATRAAFGFAGATERLVPGSNSPRFVAADRRIYSPLCLSLAVGTVLSAGRRRRLRATR